VSRTMRKLEEINDYTDIYEPVSEDDIETVEAILGFSFPEDYKRFTRQPEIEAIKKLPSLLWFVRHSSMGIIETNKQLRKRDFKPFPERLIAFATNECGDYFCLDRDAGRIVYIAPDVTVEENLARDELVYDSFEQWMDQHLKRKP
jgi:SMI1 / KNR4 family (SUKH-1)